MLYHTNITRIYIVGLGIKSWYSSSSSTSTAAGACRYGEVLFSNHPSMNQQGGEGQNYEGEIPFLTRLLDLIFRYDIMITISYYYIHYNTNYYMCIYALYIVAPII